MKLPAGATGTLRLEVLPVRDHDNADTTALLNLLRNLGDAITQADGLDGLEAGKFSPAFSGLSPHALAALAESPAQLSQARRVAAEAREAAKDAVSEFVRRNEKASTAAWFKLDSAALSFAAGDAASSSASPQRVAAMEYYRTARVARSDPVVSELKTAIEDLIAQRVVISALSDIAAGRPLRISADLPGDLLLLRPADATKVAQRRQEASVRMLHLEDSIPALVRRISERHPYAIPLCDHALVELSNSAKAPGGEPSYRSAATLQVASNYEAWRSIPVVRPAPLIWFPFSTRGRCTRLQWWIANICWFIALAPIVYKAKQFAQFTAQMDFARRLQFRDGSPDGPAPSEVWVYGLIGVYVLMIWSLVTFDIRRFRDAGRSTWWALMTAGPLCIGCVGPGIIALPLLLWRSFTPGLMRSESVEAAVLKQERTRKSAQANLMTSSKSISDKKLLDTWRADRTRTERDGPHTGS